MKPRSVVRVPCSRLSPQERKELDAILESHRKGARADPRLHEQFESDEGDSSAWWVLLALAALGGAGACGSFVLETGLAGMLSFPRLTDADSLYWALIGRKFLFGLIACVGIVVWTAFTWLTNRGRRGVVATSFATLRIKGLRAALLRHIDVARIEWTQHATRTQSFSVLVLTAGDGRILRLYTHAGWVRVALARIDQARSAAGLPPIAGEARKLPESA